MELDLLEKGIIESVYLEETGRVHSPNLIKLFFQVFSFLLLPLAFIFGLFIWQNKYVCGICLAVTLLLFSPLPRKSSEPKSLPLNPGKPFSNLTLTISWILGQILTGTVVIYILKTFLFTPIYENDSAAGFYLLFVKSIVVALAGLLAYRTVEFVLKKKAVMLRSERCTFEVTAHCLGLALKGSPEIFSGVYDKHALENNYDPLGRRKYRYTYNGLDYIIFDQGERTDNSDMMIRIDPDEPEIYYEDVWLS